MHHRYAQGGGAYMGEDGLAVRDSPALLSDPSVDPRDEPRVESRPVPLRGMMECAPVRALQIIIG